jgi:predicted GNAT superfamily acetyltransferase
MNIEIRSLTTQSEYQAFMALERQVWQGINPVPDDVLLTVQKNGGLVLGAFAQAPGGEEEMVGLLFGFLGMTSDGKVKHCSHIVGVHPEYRDHRVGSQLKRVQRERVLAQGIDLITWTYDPLQSRNAYMNLHKLGAVCNTYLPNLYGVMYDGINVGVASDRFQVDWHIASRHVDDCLAGKAAKRSLDDLVQSGAALVNPFAADDDVLPLAETSPIEGSRVLVRVPADLPALKGRSLQAAQAWRQHTAGLFQPAFARGYVAVDLVTEGAWSYYVLDKGWRPDAAR